MLRKCLRRLGIGVSITLLGLTLSYPIVDYAVKNRNEQLRNCPLYNSIEEAERDIKKYARSIGLGDHDKVSVEFDDNCDSAYSFTVPIFRIIRGESGEDVFESESYIILGKIRNRRSLKHELFHLNKTLNGGSFESFRGWYPLNSIEEWRATSYALEEDE